MRLPHRLEAAHSGAGVAAIPTCHRSNRHQTTTTSAALVFTIERALLDGDQHCSSVSRAFQAGMMTLAERVSSGPVLKQSDRVETLTARRLSLQRFEVAVVVVCCWDWNSRVCGMVVVIAFFNSFCCFRDIVERCFTSPTVLILAVVAYIIVLKLREQAILAVMESILQGSQPASSG